MERIDKKYAIIYVDREGECLKNDRFVTDAIINDYYEMSGPLQWNFYLIIAKESIQGISEDEILQEDSYARKYIMPEAAIDLFITVSFPELQEEHGKIEIIKGVDWTHAQYKATLAHGFTHLYPSWHRDHSLLYSLTQMDELRAN